jgi:uncharacterized protein (DUF362 family)
MDHNDADDRLERVFTRRRFLSTLTASAAGLLLVPYLKSGKIFAYGYDGQGAFLAQVGVTQADKYDRLLVKQKVQECLQSLGGIGDVVKSGDKVAIKINLTGGSGSALSPKLNGVPITESMWTHPEVLRAVGELLIDSGVKGSDIYIVESLWDDASFNNFGYAEVQQSLGAQMVNLNNKAPYADFTDRAVGSGHYYYSSFRVNQILSDVGVYVSIPKMKQHYEAGVTGALKNQVGMVPKQLYMMPTDQGRRAALHIEGGSSTTHLPRSICDLNLARPVHLAVIDGIKNARGGEGVWNPTFRTAEDHVVLAGKDPVATDSIAAFLMGNNPEAATLHLPGGGQCDNYLDMLRQKGMGTNHMNEIEVVGDGAGLVTSVRPESEPAVPKNHELYQNYPNPFNPSTTFRFYLANDEHVTIALYNVTGQKIETLVDGDVPQGLHELHWMPNGIAGGMYFCEMRAGRYLQTLKMIFQK